MNKTAKNIVYPVAVLTLIALICTFLLALSNKIFYVAPTLNAQTVSVLNGLCPSGVSDAQAEQDKYFVMFSDSDLAAAGGFKISAEKTTSSNSLKAVYYAAKGDGQGTLFLETTGQGYNPVTLVTAFSLEDGKAIVKGVATKKMIEDGGSFKQIFNPEYFDLYLEEIDGKEYDMTDNDIIAVTGATTRNSVRGLNQAVSLAARSATKLAPYAQVLSEKATAKAEVNNG
jgi:hypothetical protein